jgi:ATP-dependent Lon protease
MKMHFVETMDQVLKVALEGPLPQILEETPQTITPIAPQAGESPATHQ